MKYTKKRVDIIRQSLSNMSSKTAAANAAGISLVTFWLWYNNKPEFKKLVDETINEVEDRGKHMAIQTIYKAMDTSWQAAAWMLERKYPNEYGRKDRVDMDVNEKKIIFQIGVKETDNIIDNDDILKITNNKLLDSHIDEDDEKE